MNLSHIVKQSCSRIVRLRDYSTTRLSNASGQAGIEMLIVMLLLVPLLLGGFSLAQGVSARHALEQATALAARRIALNPAEWATALNAVQTAVEGALLGHTSSVTCQVTAAGQPVDPNGLAFGNVFAVTCSTPFQAHIPFVSTPGRVLTTTHRESMERYP